MIVSLLFFISFNICKSGDLSCVILIVISYFLFSFNFHDGLLQATYLDTSSHSGGPEHLQIMLYLVIV